MTDTTHDRYTTLRRSAQVTAFAALLALAALACPVLGRLFPGSIFAFLSSSPFITASQAMSAVALALAVSAILFSRP